MTAKERAQVCTFFAVGKYVPAMFIGSRTIAFDGRLILLHDHHTWFAIVRIKSFVEIVSKR